MPTSRFDNVASISNQTVPGVSTGWTAPAIPILSETTVLTKIIAPGKVFLLDRASFIGLADAVCRVKVNGTTIAFMQIAWTTRSDARYFPFGHSVLAGETLTITIVNCGKASADYDGSIMGRTIDS